jgi:hypothetical protein
MNAKLAVEHGAGEVHVDNLRSDIRVNLSNGGVTLSLPPDSRYNIDAKCTIGDVTSDFPGLAKRSPWLFGHRFVEATAEAPSLHLRVGYGDITILKIQKPLSAGPVTH